MEPRTVEQRKKDVLDKLQNDVDIWVASASATGDSYLIPLSFYWDGQRLTIATPKNSRTARNLRRAGVARMALGPTRDVVILEGALEFIPVGVDENLADAHAKKAGFDPRKSREEFVYICITPRRIQAWREENELRGRDTMVDGRWLA